MRICCTQAVDMRSLVTQVLHTPGASWGCCRGCQYQQQQHHLHLPTSQQFCSPRAALHQRSPCSRQGQPMERLHLHLEHVHHTVYTTRVFGGQVSGMLSFPSIPVRPCVQLGSHQPAVRISSSAVVLSRANLPQLRLPTHGVSATLVWVLQGRLCRSW